MIGYCECGCGTPTRIAPQSHTEKGWVKGEPVRFATGHWARTKARETFESRYTVDDNGCWVWHRATDISGYGVYWDGEKQRKAHRHSYTMSKGPIPEGLQLDHLCRVRACVNPDHLEPVTGRENTLRGDTLSALNAAKTHCKRGHAFDEANTYHYRGSRHCRTCRREQQRSI